MSAEQTGADASKVDAFAHAQTASSIATTTKSPTLWSTQFKLL